MSQVRPIEDLFAELVELNTAAERDAYLDEVCGEDKELRSRLEKLLAANEKAGSFLQDGESLEVTAARDHDKMIGSSIGTYKIREQIGDGGMGVVYVAEQERPLRRKVAIKVIKPGMDSKAVLARFDAERNALALMNHPNIAKVLDAGTTEHGHPYFVMELIHGEPVTEYCDQKKLTIKQRLELFTQICQAVQHAHQKGVIHRDIKPTNVLVTELDGKPVPKMIDFGVAKALNQSLTDRSIYTSFQSVIGTPLYMSPEQASLSAVDVDTRSDIYSLGVLLYELLTGTTPFEQSKLKDAAQHEVLRIIREDEPPRPSNRISTLGKAATHISQSRQTQTERLGRLVKGDLDWIVMTALAKERSRRYKTADALANDLRKHLADEPIDARPPSTVYRLGRFCKRHRASVTIGVVIVALLVLAVAGTTTGWTRASKYLIELQDETYQSIVFRAIVDQSIDAKTVEAVDKYRLPEERTEVLHGLEAFYSGDYKDARNHLVNGEKTVATFAVLAFAELLSGSDEGFVEAVVRMNKLRPISAQDHLLLAQLCCVAHSDLGVHHIDKASGLRDVGLHGQVIEAIADANLARHDNDLETARKGIEILEAASTLHPDNLFLEEQLLLLYHIGSRIAHRLDKNTEANEFLERADVLACRLEMSGRASITWLPAHYAERGDFDAALTLLEQSPHAGFRVVDYVGIALLAGEEARALNRLNEIPRDGFYKLLGLGLLYATDPSKQDVVNDIFEKIVARRKDCDARIFAMRMLALSGASEGRLRAAARKLQDDSIELVVPWQYNIAFWATGGQSELPYRTRFGSQFDVALRELSLGKNAAARELLLEYEDHALPGDFVWLSRFMRKSVLPEKDALPNE